MRRLMIHLVFLALFAVSALAQSARTGTTASLTAAEQASTVSTDGYGTVSFQITGTWSGTITFEATNASTWVAILATNITSGASATTTTANGVYAVASSNARFVRARMSSYSSGTAAVLPVSTSQAPGGAGGGAASSVSVTSVPADPFGANADAASATGSISAKLRFIAGTGIPITSSALPTGAATAANQASQTSTLNDILTAAQVIDNGVAVDNSAFTTGSSSGNPMSGLYDNASPATMTEDRVGVIRMSRHKAAHVTLYDTAGAPLAPGAQYVEDAAHASGDTLMMVGAVRRDTAVSSSGAAGDNSTLNTDAKGRQWVNAGPVRHVWQWGYAPPAGGLTSTTAVTAKAGVANRYACISAVQVINSHQTTSTEVLVYASPGAGASTDTLFRWWAQAVGGGVAGSIPVNRCSPNTGDTLKIVEKTTTGTAGVLVNLQGFEE